MHSLQRRPLINFPNFKLAVVEFGTASHCAHALPPHHDAAAGASSVSVPLTQASSWHCA